MSQNYAHFQENSMKPASRKMILWVLRLVLASGRTPTLDFVHKLQSLTQDEIKSVVSRAQSNRDRYFKQTRTKLEDWGDLHAPAEACYRGEIRAAMQLLEGKPSRQNRAVQFVPTAEPVREVVLDTPGRGSPNSYTDSSPF